jgi:hypothetical protein
MDFNDLLAKLTTTLQFAGCALLATTGTARSDDFAASTPVESPQTAIVVDSEAVRIDVEPIAAEPWRREIDAVTKSRALQAGRPLSLMRLTLEDEVTAEPKASDANVTPPPQVNGVPLFIPAGAPSRLVDGLPRREPGRFSKKAPWIQLGAVKLMTPEETNNGGGGAFKEIENGQFVVLEHVNNSRRRDGRDCVQVGSMTHHQGELWIQVPPPGQLGIVGDVVLKRTPPAEMGRLVVEVIDQSGKGVRVDNLLVGCVAVGGPYGARFPFVANGISATPQVSSGNYKVLLPDFDVAKSRWDVSISPGEVTYLRLSADSQQNLRFVEQKQIAFADANSPK